jgi:uncharacterized membrane protein
MKAYKAQERRRNYSMFGKRQNQQRNWGYPGYGYGSSQCGGYGYGGYGGYGYGGGGGVFALIVVLFILLIIIGATLR